MKSMLTTDADNSDFKTTSPQGDGNGFGNNADNHGIADDFKTTSPQGDGNAQARYDDTVSQRHRF